MIEVGLLIFDEVDLLDFGGPYEVFLTADRLDRRGGGTGRFNVTVVGPSTDPVTAFGGVQLIPQVGAGSAGAFDIVVIPGAVAIDEVAARIEVRQAVETLTGRAAITTSVCTGAFLLGDAGLLSGKPWTTHFEDVAALSQRLDGDGGGRAAVGWVDAGPVVTGGGLSSGIAMTLHLVDRTVDRELAVATARQIEYAWDPDGGVLAWG